MKKLTTGLACLFAIGFTSLPSVAQDNILAEKPIYTLGEAKT